MRKSCKLWTPLLRFRRCLSLATAVVFLAGSSFAQTVVWFGTPPTLGGSGLWTSTQPNWSNGVWVNGETALFGGSPGIVTINSAGMTAGGLQFATPGYTLNGQALTLTGNANVSTVGPTTIGMQILGSANVTTSGLPDFTAPVSASQLNVGAGQTQLSGSATLSGASPVSVTGGGQLYLSAGAFLSATGGTTTVNDASGASLLLDGSAMHTGALTVGTTGSGTVTVQNSSSLRIDNALTLGAGGQVSVTTGNGYLFAGTLASSGGAGSINLTNGTSLFLDGDSGSGNYSGAITGLGAINKSGNSVQTLSGNNSSYTGVVSISGGSIVVGSTNALQNARVQLTSDNGLDLSTVETANIASLLGAGSLNLSNASLTIGSRNTNDTLSGVISGSVGGVLIKTGTGIQTLSGGGSFSNLNAQSGTLVLNGAPLTLSNSGSLFIGTASSNGTATVTNGETLTATEIVRFLSGGSVLNVNNGSVTTSALESQVGGTVNLSAGTSLLLNGSVNTAFNGSIAGGGSLTLVAGSSSIQTLSGANTFSGPTSINGGQIVLGNSNALQNSAVSINIDGGLNLNNLSAATIASLSGTGALNLGNTQLNVGGNGATTSYSGVFSSGAGGALVETGVGALTLTGGGTLGGLTVSSGEIALNAGAYTLLTGGLSMGFASTLTIAGSKLDNSQAGTLISNNGNVEVQAGGTFITGNLSFNGGISIQGGIVTSQAATLGAGPFDGVVNVTGNNSQWTAASLTLGTPQTDLSYGAVSVTNGGSAGISGRTTFNTTRSIVSIGDGSMFSTGSLSSVAFGGIEVSMYGAAVLNITNGSSDNFAGVIDGTGTINKSGIGVQTLSGVNTFSGATNINGGQIALGNANALASSAVAVNTANGLNIGGLGTATIGSLSGSGSGSLDLAGQTLNVGGNNLSTTFAGTISDLSASGTGTLVQNGSGTLTLTGNNSNFGELIANGGSLVVDGGGAGKTLTLNGSSNDNSDALKVLSNMTIQNGAVVNANVAPSSEAVVYGTLTVDHSTLDAATLAVNARGTLALQNGAVLNANTAGILGSVNVSGGATATSGNLLLESGQITVGGSGSVWNTTQLVFGHDPGSHTLTLNQGGQMNVSGQTQFLSSGNVITVNGGGLSTGTLLDFGGNSIVLQADPSNGAALTLTGNTNTDNFVSTISGAGSLTVNMGANGVQTLSGTNTFTGATTINSGELVLNNANALENSTVVLNTANGLVLNGVAATLGGLAGSPGGSLNLATPGIFIGNNNADTTYSGAITGSGDVTKIGTGTLTLAGNTNLDQMAVTNGNLAVSGPAGVSSDISVVVNGAGLTVQAGAQVNSQTGFLGSQSGLTGTALVTGANSIWTTNELYLGASGVPPVPGGTGNLTITNGGAVNVTDALTIGTATSSVTISGGSLTIGRLSTLPGVPVNIVLQADPSSGNATQNLMGVGSVNPVISGGVSVAGAGAALNFTGVGTVNAVISGGGSVSVAGAGAHQVFNGNNTYTGTTTVSGGAILIQQGGTNDSQIHVASGSTFNGNQTVLQALSGFGAYTADGGGTINFSAGTSVIGGFLDGPGSQNARGATFTGTTIDGGAALSILNATQFNHVSDYGTVAANAGNTLTWNAGQIGSGGELDVTGIVNATALSSNGVIDIGPGGVLNATGTNLVLGGGSRTYLGSVSTPGGLITEIVTAVIDLDGGLLVNNGTIEGTVDVNFGGLAEGAGAYGQVNIANGGTFHPGNSPGTVNSSGATFGAGGQLDFDITDADGTEGDDWSYWKVSGDLDITAGSARNDLFTINLDSLSSTDAPGSLANFDPTRSYAWTILNAGNISGFSANEFQLNTSGFANSLGGGSFSIVDTGAALQLDFTSGNSGSSGGPAAPEPGTWALIAAGLTLLVLLRRRQQMR